MCKLLAIVVFLVGGFIFERAEVCASTGNAPCEIVDMHHAQLVCNNRHNIDFESPSTVVVPSARTTTSNILRQAQLRIYHFVAVESIRTATNYPTSQFIHRLGSSSRAVDFYLYTLCRLRL